MMDDASIPGKRAPPLLYPRSSHKKVKLSFLEQFRSSWSEVSTGKFGVNFMHTSHAGICLELSAAHRIHSKYVS